MIKSLILTMCCCAFASTPKITQPVKNSSSAYSTSIALEHYAIVPNVQSIEVISGKSEYASEETLEQYKLNQRVIVNQVVKDYADMRPVERNTLINALSDVDIDVIEGSSYAVIEFHVTDYIVNSVLPNIYQTYPYVSYFPSIVINTYYTQNTQYVEMGGNYFVSPTPNYTGVFSVPDSYNIQWLNTRLSSGYYRMYLRFDSAWLRDNPTIACLDITAVHYKTPRAQGSSINMYNLRNVDLFYWRNPQIFINQGIDIGLEGAANAENAMNGMFSLFGKGFEAIGNLLSTRIFGYITLGMLLGIPIVALIVGVIFKLLKG